MYLRQESFHHNDGQTVVLTPVRRSRDVQFSRRRGYISPATLSPFQRILLTTNGTITHVIEAYAGEQIRLVKLSEELITLDRDIPALQLSRGMEVMERKILLQGSLSHRHYVYAESILVLDRLDEGMRNELLHTKTPIGKLWVDRKVEIFKENLDAGLEAAEEEAEYFDIDPQDNLLFRTYCVRTQGKYTMMITEKFPETDFC